MTARRPSLVAGAAALAALLATTGPAPAQLVQPAPAAPAATDRPQLLPSRDAVLGYRLAPGAGETIDVRVSLQAGGAALRIDLPDHSYMVATPPNKQLVLVVPLEQTAMDLPWADGPQPLFLLDPRMRFTRKGEATVAGQRCTIWDTVLDRVRSTVCVTADGIVLRSQSQDAAGRRNLIEAFILRYQALVESDFAIPAEFERLSAVAGKP